MSKEKNKQRNELTKIANESDIANKVGEAMNVGSRKAMITMSESEYIQRLATCYALGFIYETNADITDEEIKSLSERAIKTATTQLDIAKRI